jgi:hypothetical protein
MELDAGTQLEGPLLLVGPSTFHSVASAGIITLAFSAEDRSHIVSPSYMVRPVKRLPSKP